MRISDWSSDVCFSDLTLPRSNLPACSKVAPRDIPTVSRREGRSQDWVHCLQLARHEDQPASRKIALRPVSRNRPSRLLPGTNSGRSEEHTSELQSLMRISYAVFCLKKKNKNQNYNKN